MSPSRLRRPFALALAAVALTGCGTVSSGVAASIDGEEISVARVDDVAEALCLGVEPDLEEAGQALPMSQARQTALNLLALSEAADQVAQEYGVTPGTDYERQVALLEAAEETRAIPEDLRADYVAAGATEAKVDGVIRAVGAEILAEQGVADAPEEQVLQAGSDVFWRWAEDRDVEVNPVFDVAVEEGQLRPAGGTSSVAVPVSDTAVGGGAQVDPAAAASLPGHLRCG